MRKFFKPITLLALGLILSGPVALRANAVSTDPNCPGVTTGPLETSSSYAFTAIGNDTSAGANATATLVGSLETDSRGCPTGGFLALNDNGSPCLASFTSVLTENASPPNTGTFVWTSSCFSAAEEFAYATASDFSDTLYFSSNLATSGMVTTPDNFAFAGKVQEFDDIDAPPTLTLSLTVKRKKH